MEQKEKELHQCFTQCQNLFYSHQTMQLYQTIQPNDYHDMCHAHEALGISMYNIYLEELIYYYRRHPEQLTATGKKYHAMLYYNYLLQEHTIAHFNQSLSFHETNMQKMWEQAVCRNSIKEILPQLQKQKVFIQQFFKQYYRLERFDYVTVFEKHYKISPINELMINLKAFQHSIQQLYSTVWGQERRFVRTNYLTTISPEQQRTILQAIAIYLNEQFQIGQLTVHVTDHLQSTHFQTGPATFHFCLSNHLQFAQQIAVLLKLIGRVMDQANYSVPQLSWEMFIQQLPLLSEQFLHDISTIILPFCSNQHVTYKKIEIELRGHYLQLRQNPLQADLIAPLQQLVYNYLEFDIESNWFNEQFDTDQLPLQWKEAAFKYVYKKPPHHMEGILRLHGLYKGTFGEAFHKFISYYQLFYLWDSKQIHNWLDFLIEQWQTKRTVSIGQPRKSVQAARSIYRLYRVPFKKHS